MKINTRNSLAVLLATVITLSPTVAIAAGTMAPKDEVVYVTMSAGGAVDGIYVVNSIYYGSGGTAVLDDYGSYSEVKNLTTTQPLVVRDGKVEVDAPTFESGGDRFYYQGTLTDVTLPWDVVVSYKLNGSVLTPEALAGASGSLAMTISVATKADAAPLYKDNFALQLSLTLDSERCHNIVATDATIANAGESKQLAYTMLPGSSKSYTVTADVTDFEFGGIQIAAVPFNMAIDRPDTSEFKNQLTDMKDGVGELDDGATKLDNGVAELYDGVWELRDGAADLNDGVYQMVDGLPALQAGAKGLQGGFAQLATFRAFLPTNLPLPALPNPQAAFDAVLAQLSGGYDGIVGGIGDLSDGIRSLYSGTQGIKDGTQRLYEGVAELKDGTAELTDGTGRFRDETSDIDGKIDTEIDKMLNQYSKGEATLTSFVSPRNTNITGLQFVMRTEGVSKPKATIAQVVDTSPTTLWQRVMNLFS